ncbi:hypothetical protein WHR41_00810 [Cladosporium halotolerans]|uniref:DUF1365-domain-containing protein n=1 Tax=Cladosporium halotolerans TaxID=1052096 RepID=A0AB34L2R7_9PEZI
MREPASVTNAGDGATVPTKKLLIWTWAFSTLWWSIFTPPHKTFAARLLLLQPAWAARIYTGDGTWLQDLTLLLLSHACYTAWAGYWSIPRIYGWISSSYWDDAMQIYILVFSMLGVCGICAGGITHRGNQLDEQHFHGPARTAAIEEALLPPLLIPSKTTHSRMFPQKHSFAYSYLFVGVPVGMTGRTSQALSVDGSPSSWFNIRSSDYLFRDAGNTSLAEKLRIYLEKQGVSDQHYSFAYLVTAPRFMGYSFNPVSFWYIYNGDAELKYMILEVNNTFDERRIYLLRPGSGDDEMDPEDEEKTDNALYFKETWQKDFHVSPFNSRKGSYSLRAIDPLAAFEEFGHVRVDNNIVLRSDKGHPKLVARVFSTDQPTSAMDVGNLQLVRFILSWWWVGFVTFPRIVAQAGQLFFKKKLHVWFRPEVTPTSIGRSYDAEEYELEAFFRAFLTHAVEGSDRSLRVIYQAAHHSDSELVLYSSGYLREKEHERTLSVKILSPAFYSRFVHYAHAKEAFDRECLATDEKNRTLLIEPPHLLPTLLDAIKHATPPASPSPSSSNFLDTARWALLRSLRCPPAEPAYPSTHPDPSTIAVDIRAFPRSELDAFARHQSADGASYRRTCTKLFLAQRFALGLPVLVTALDLLFRGVLLAVAVVYVSGSEVFDVLRPRAHGMEDVLPVLGLLAVANGVHVWSFLKG